jgi:hypothetical protein
MLKSASRNANHQRHLVRMLCNDHPPPHFHAHYGVFEAPIAIPHSKRWKGHSGSCAELVREWAMMHRDELVKDWRLCREKAPRAYIEPLP